MARRLLRQNGKLVFRVIAYESPHAKIGLVTPRGCPTTIPKTAKAVLGTFFDAQTHYPISHGKMGGGFKRDALFKSSMVTLKRETVLKMVFG